jgi:glucokinase
MDNVLGIEVGGSKLQLVITDQTLRPLETLRFAIDRRQGGEAIRAQIEKSLPGLLKHGVRTIGVGFGGPVDKASGKIFKSYHINGWSEFPLKEWLKKLSGLDVIVENDANVAALGEALAGAGKDYVRVFYATLGSGVGAGYVINKRIYNGALQGELEFGHVRLNKDGLTVQDSCSGWAVNQKILKVTNSTLPTKLKSFALNYQGAESLALLPAMREGDDTALQIFHETVDDLAFGLSHAIHLLNPDTIVLGGGLSLIGEPLRLEVEGKIQKYIMDVFVPGPRIQLAGLNELAVPIGAAALALNN